MGAADGLSVADTPDGLFVGQGWTDSQNQQ